MLFRSEISETLLAKHFDGPSMFVAAAEETQNDLVGGRGDAYCGMLNASYNLKLRNIKACNHIAIIKKRSGVIKCLKT